MVRKIQRLLSSWNPDETIGRIDKIFPPIFLAFIVLFILLISILSVVAWRTDGFVERNAQFTEFAVCNKPISIHNEQDREQYCNLTFYEKSNVLYVCGLIETPKLIPNHFFPLAIYVHESENNELVYSNPVGDKFYNTIFCRKIFLPEDSPSNSYMVTVYHFRDIIATEYFELK